MFLIGPEWSVRTVGWEDGVGRVGMGVVSDNPLQ